MVTAGKYLDITGSIIVILKTDETVELINRYGCQILGYREEEIVGRNWFDHFLPAETRESTRAAFNQILKGKIDPVSVFENPILTCRGEKRLIAWNNTVVKDDNGRVTGTLSSGQDITERQRAEEELRRSEEKYRSFFEEDLTGDYISSPDGQILFCNLAFLRMFGFESMPQAQKYNVNLLYPGGEERVKLIGLLKEKRKLEHYQMELRRLDGTPIYVEANINGKFDAAGNLLEMQGYLFDVTQHRRTEEQFWQAQKMEAIGRLAGGVAHDFNNLLSVINGYSDLVLQRLPPNDPLRKDISMILQAGKKAEALTRQLLAFSRRQMMQPRILSLNSLIGDLEKMLRRLIGEDVQLITRLHPQLGYVKADPTQLEQVLLNLAVNSRDAMPQGGKLIIETSNANFSSDMVQEKVTMSAGPYILLAVTDSGVGMDVRTRSNIFEPFFTTKEKGKGTGLGLSTVYGIVKQSGGYIWVYSEPGKGTTFKIYLPQAEGNPEEQVVSRAAPETLRGTETVLLVEDDQDVRDVSEVILSQFGYRVLTANGGEEALRLARGGRSRIDLMITDVVMPGMSGTELVQRLNSGKNGMKVLFLSGYTDEAISQHGLLRGGRHFLAKPFSSEVLLRKVREILDESKA